MARFRWIRVYLFSFSVLVLIFSGAAMGQFSPTRAPKLTVSKTASPTEFTAVGEKITYTYKVTSANEASSGLKITDSPLDAQPVCDRTEIKANETATCTATYTITQADINRGVVESKATIQVNYIYANTSNGCCGCGRSTTYQTGGLSAEVSASVKYANRLLPSATLTITPTPALAPILGGIVSYCEKNSGAVNLTLDPTADPAMVNADLASGLLVIKIGGIPAICSVPAGTQIIGCAVNPNILVTFPIQVEALAQSTPGNLVSVNNFMYDGTGCLAVSPDKVEEPQEEETATPTPMPQ